MSEGNGLPIASPDARRPGARSKPSAPITPLRLVPSDERTLRLNTPMPGRWLDLGRRGRTWIREQRGPEGAPTLVLLHGLGATGGLNWAGSQAFLGDQFRMVAIDHRGHGRGIRTRDFRLEDCADDVAAAVDALGIDRPIVVGYSMGGPVASLLWRRHPGLVGGLVLCATSRNFGGSPAEKLAFASMGLAGSAPVLFPTGVIRTYLSLMGAVPLPQPAVVKDVRWALDELAGHDPRSILQAAATLGRFNSAPWIGDVDVPTSVVVTGCDQMVPPARQLRLARSIAHASVHCLDVGHLCVGGGSAKVEFLSTLRRACAEVASA